MGAYEDRIEIATLRAELQTFKREFNQKAEALVSRMDRAMNDLLLAATDEHESGEPVNKKSLTYGKPGIETSTGTTQVDPTIKPVRVVSKRACSLCHEPGHTAPNCPRAHEVQAAKRERVEKREAKREKPKRHVSPERRAQLAAQLKKAREARSKR